jgi:hypothetical protein
VKAILREKYPRPDPLGEILKAALPAFKAFSEAAERFASNPLFRERS